MARELLAFVPLAVFTNTAFGPPFDPVLLWFASGHALPEAWAFIVVGSFCAGLGGALEAGIVRGIRRRPAAGVAPADAASPRFYAFSFAMAASPVPFSLVRLAAVRQRPHPAPYAAAIAAGRLPRYALTVLAWNHLRLPAWLAATLVAMAVGVALVGWWRGTRNT